MPTNDLAIHTGKEILLAYYNRIYQRTLSIANVDFGIPVKLDTPGTTHNTTIKITPKLGSRYYGTIKLNYDRIHKSLLGNIVVDKGSAVRVHDLLPAINEKYGIKLTDEDVENDLLDPFTNGDIVVDLVIKPDSVLFYDGTFIYTPNYPDPNGATPEAIEQYGHWSPTKSSNLVILSNENYTAVMDNFNLAITQIPVYKGRVYWEVVVDIGNLYIGVALPSAPKATIATDVLGYNSHSWVLNTRTGEILHDSAVFSYIPPLATGTTVGVMLDHEAGTLQFLINSEVKPFAFTSLEVHSELYPVIASSDVTTSRGTANFGEYPFFYDATIPSNYTRGLYTLFGEDGAIPPPSSGGGTGTNPPAGTILSTWCVEEDLFTAVASGDGTFVVNTEYDSTECGYDPNNPDIIDGGNGGSGGVGKPVLTAVGNPFTMDEGDVLTITYNLSRALSEDLTLVLDLSYSGASAADITSIEFKPYSESVWNTVNDGSNLLIPDGDTVFEIRITTEADSLTEGTETINVSVRESVSGTLLENSTPLVVNVAINDTSVASPTNPTLSKVGNSFATMDEDNPLIMHYVLNTNLLTDTTLIFDVTHTSTDITDFVSFEYRLSEEVSYTAINPGDTILFTTTHTGIYIRITPVADITTEGDETFVISLEEDVIGTGLANSGPIEVNVTLEDTSVGVDTTIVYEDDFVNDNKGFSGTAFSDYYLTTYGNVTFNDDGGTPTINNATYTAGVGLELNFSNDVNYGRDNLPLMFNSMPVFASKARYTLEYETNSYTAFDDNSVIVSLPTGTPLPVDYLYTESSIDFNIVADTDVDGITASWNIGSTIFINADSSDNSTREPKINFGSGLKTIPGNRGDNGYGDGVITHPVSGSVKLVIEVEKTGDDFEILYYVNDNLVLTKNITHTVSPAFTTGFRCIPDIRNIGSMSIVLKKYMIQDLS